MLLFPTAGEKADSNNRILNAILTCLSAYKAESNKLYNEILINGGTNRYFDILRKRFANGKKENISQNIVITNKDEHLPVHRNSHGTDFVSESWNIDI